MNKKKILNISSSILIIILSLFLLVKINFVKVVVSGNSMSPTLVGSTSEGFEYGYTDRFLFKIIGLDRYDIVVVKKDNELWIKRVIALPNESIQIKNGLVYVNDKVLEDDNYCSEIILNAGIANEKITLGKNEYFVLGDNRNHSVDSRNELLGVVNIKNIYGHSFISRGICNDQLCKSIDYKYNYEVKGW